MLAAKIRSDFERNPAECGGVRVELESDRIRVEFRSDSDRNRPEFDSLVPRSTVLANKNPIGTGRNSAKNRSRINRNLTANQPQSDRS